VLFAEGTTSDGGRVLPFRSALIGAARSALGDEAATVTILPLSVIYTRRHGLPLGKAGRPFVAWYGDMDLLPHLSDILAGGPLDVRVEFGEPLDFTPDTDRKKATRIAEERVRAAARRSITGRADFDAGRETAMEV
jgi:lyso-ornithine lipid O-acyltransferase